MVAAAKVASFGSLTRIVTAIRNMNEKLRLDVWDFNNLAEFSSLTHMGTLELDQSPGVIAIKNLGAVGDFSKPARFVIAHNTFNVLALLTVESLQVDVNGILDLKDTEKFEQGPIVSVDESIPNRIAIDAVGDGDGNFFNGQGFMTTLIAGSGKLQVVTWKVNPSDDDPLTDDGAITLKDNKETLGEVGAQDVSATTTVVTLEADKRVKLIKWLVADDGTITRANTDRTLGYQATHVAATGDLLTAVQIYPFGTLKVASWTILK